MDFLKRHAEIAANFSTIGALLASLIWLSGGSIPPWATKDDVRQMLDADRDIDKCREANVRYVRAQEELRRNPKDETAVDLFRDSTEDIAETPGCHAVTLP